MQKTHTWCTAALIEMAKPVRGAAGAFTHVVCELPVVSGLLAWRRVSERGNACAFLAARARRGSVRGAGVRWIEEGCGEWWGIGCEGVLRAEGEAGGGTGARE